jgi:hypothetical protein
MKIYDRCKHLVISSIQIQIKQGPRNNGAENYKYIESQNKIDVKGGNIPKAHAQLDNNKGTAFMFLRLGSAETWGFLKGYQGFQKTQMRNGGRILLAVQNL